MAIHSSNLVLENPHGPRILVGYSPWGLKELDTIERLSNILDITSGLGKDYRNSLYNFCTFII